LTYEALGSNGLWAWLQSGRLADPHAAGLDGVLGKDTKIVWRMRGTGDIAFVAIGPGGPARGTDRCHRARFDVAAPGRRVGELVPLRRTRLLADPCDAQRRERRSVAARALLVETSHQRALGCLSASVIVSAVRRGVVAVIVAVVLTAAPGASATESTIVRGVGIGKIRIGMTRTQVQRLLGRDYTKNATTTIAGAEYVELGWDFSTLSVGFVDGRVTQVETTLRGEKTREGIGVGSSFKAAARAYPQAICTLYFVSPGTGTSYGPSSAQRHAQTALVVAGNRKQLAFLVGTERPIGYGDLGPVVVKGVIVRNPPRGSVDIPPNTRCEPGWRERGRP